MQTAECVCTLDGKTCGAGMANARAAVAAALRPIAAVSATVSQGSAMLAATGSAAALNHTVTLYQWRETNGVPVTLQNASSATATVALPSCGLTTVQLTVVDDAGQADTADVVLSPAGATSTAPTAATNRGCTATVPAVEVAVCPTAVQVPIGTGSQSFSASVAYSDNTDVSWQVNGITGGNATVGSISSTGVFTPPAALPSAASEVITAVAAADSSVTATSVVTLETTSTVTSTTPTPSPSHGGGGVLALWSALVLAAVLAGRSVRLRFAGR
jgi:hypothetical protein